MSNLIFQGNTIDNFGEFLPAPYIETITIFEDSFEVSLCFFLTVAEGQDVDEVIDRLAGSGGIRPYVMFAFNQMEYGLSPVITGKKNIFDYYVNGDWLSNTDNQSFDTLILEQNEHLWENYSSGQTPYLVDENGNNVIKVQTTITKTLSDLAGGNPLTWGYITDFRIFAFSSVYDVFTDREDLNTKLSNPTLFKREISDISYERIMENGKLATATASIEYFDRNKQIYNPQPLRSIVGRYYKTKGGKTNNQKIIGYFNDLINLYSSEAGNPLLKIIKNIAYILETYDDNPSLLVELNHLRKLFPNKSLSTELGRFYRRYTKRIFTMNKAIESSPQVFKKIIRNPKIFDERFADNSAWSTPSHVDTEPYQKYIYSPDAVFKIDIHVLAGSMSDSDSTDIVLNSGYVWFDYEKALMQVADFNKIAPLSKLARYGIPIDYTKFRVTKAKYTRRHDDGGASSIEAALDETALYPVSATSTIIDNSNRSEFMMVTTPYMTDSAIDAYTHPETAGVLESDLEAAGYLVEPQNTYMVLRNWMPLNGSEAWNTDYRLMCFEIRDYMRYPFRDSWSDEFVFKVTIEDSSIEMYTLLRDQYEEALRNYNNDYIELAFADKPLAYDTVTGLFSQYFIDGITAAYTNNAPEAPWYRAPLLYVMFRDLLHDEFGGDISKIVEETLVICNNINPINGSYHAALQFYDQMQKFLDDSIKGPVGSEVNSLVSSSGNEKLIEATNSVEASTWTAAEPEEEATEGTTGAGGMPAWEYPGNATQQAIDDAQREVAIGMEEPRDVTFEGAAGGGGVWGDSSKAGGGVDSGAAPGTGNTGNY